MKILYVSKDGLPDCAAGMRVDAISKVFESSGHKVDVLSERSLSSHVDKAILCDKDVTLLYNGRRYYFSKECASKNKFVQYFVFLVEILFAIQVYDRIKYHIKKDGYQVIILYNESYILTYKLQKFCKKNKISLIGDVTEWYEKVNQVKHFEQIIRPRSVNRRINRLDSKLDGIIAISPFLYEYYYQKGVKVVFVPPIITTFLKPKKQTSYKSIKLVYAGSPGEKDLLLPLISAVDKFNKNYGLTFKLQLIGIDNDYVSHLFGNKPCGVNAYGRLPHDKCLDIIYSSDFGFLLRRPLRYAKAGFSTKFSEAMSLGVPMICNAVGGCDTIIKDRIDGFLLKNSEVDTIFDFLGQLKLFCQSPNQIYEMKMKAYEKAISVFSPLTYKDKLNRLLQN